MSVLKRWSGGRSGGALGISADRTTVMTPSRMKTGRNESMYAIVAQSGTAGAFSLRDSVASAPSKTLGPGWTNAKWGGTPGPQPTPTSACYWYLSVLEVAAGPGGPARTRGSAPPLAEVFSPLDGLQAHEIHSCRRQAYGTLTSAQ